MGVLKELLQILERRRAGWDAANAASDHLRRVCEADERQSVISIASQRSDAADDAANKVERELEDFVNARADDIMDALRASESESGEHG